jgi:2-polyprenyl-3-methyl-5-hydroxy-6-metoxy-1,4-benzoquinol methylase
MPDSLEDVKPYYKNPRPDVLPFVPSGVKRLLDVGCGAGAFASFLKEDRGCEVWGIEAVPEMAALAEARLDKLFVGDALEIIPTLPRGQFDLVSFNDVLEHMIWPDKVLELTLPLLAPGGHVLASIPNIRYWEAMWEILDEGEFRYRDSGIFDRTHLRFFTKKSATRMFEEAGYEIELVEGINRRAGRKLKLLDLLTRGKHHDVQYLQFVFLARPGKVLSVEC